ncbi:hypothetical protein BDV98DRAFT_566219 [Pterulicium gracile]|uniref:DRBM domain-containing protein n=1 Tax=Pterulicium gracile TaxID=1884261 RepID=A0A5C3QPC1_9AGAR|nr:hypothetical protein BDV98DRAFT_566219 [Pterula gracilis]
MLADRDQRYRMRLNNWVQTYPLHVRPMLQWDSSEALHDSSGNTYFVICVYISDHLYGLGQHHSKRRAREIAAREAIHCLAREGYSVA